MFSKLFWTWTAVAALSLPLWADTTWVAGGTVSADWDSANSPYMVAADITVLSNGHLTIGPGVRVVMMGNSRLTVHGHLETLGTAADSVVFTSDSAQSLAWDGIYCTGTALGDTTVLRYTVIENTYRHQASYGHGAGICLAAAHGLARLESCTFRRCRAARGGAIEVMGDSCAVAAYDCEMTNCHGSIAGSVYINQTSTAYFKRCNIHHSSALDGGAVEIESALPVAFDSCAIHDDSSAIWGGAILIMGAVTQTRMTNCTFYNNRAAIGGAVFVMGNGSLMDHCLFYDNLTTSTAIIQLGGSGTSLQHCTIVGNTGTGNTMAVLVDGMSDISGCIVAFNHGMRGVYYDVAGLVPLRYSAVYGNQFGNFGGSNLPPGLGVIDSLNANGDSCDAYSNLLLDPLFADTAAHDYHLTAESPCIDAGAPASGHDPDGTVADIGAFYYPHPEAAERPLSPYPLSLSLSSSPNPFNAATWIDFDLPRAGMVSLKVFDILGREVRVLQYSLLSAGSHRLMFDGSDLASGIYLLRLDADGAALSQKIVLLK